MAVIIRVAEDMAAAVPVLVHAPVLVQVADVRDVARRILINPKRITAENRRNMVFFKHFHPKNAKKHAFLRAFLFEY